MNKSGDKFSLLSMKEKLAIATYNNSEELLNQRSEILNGCGHKNKLLLNRLLSMCFVQLCSCIYLSVCPHNFLVQFP